MVMPRKPALIIEPIANLFEKALQRIVWIADSIALLAELRGNDPRCFMGYYVIHFPICSIKRFPRMLVFAGAR